MITINVKKNTKLKSKEVNNLIQFIIWCIFIVACYFVRRWKFCNVICLSFLVMLFLFYALCFLWPNLQSLSLYHFDTQSLMYDLLNSASEIPNIWIASIAFKLFCDKRFLVSVFTMFMCWKTFPDLRLKTVHINKFQWSKICPSSLVCLYLGLRSFPTSRSD